jgi:hypothetical protein
MKALADLSLNKLTLPSMETGSLIQLISSGVGACCKIAPHSALRSGFDSPVVFDSTRTEAVQRPPAAGTVCTATLDWIAVHFFAKFRPPLGRCHTQDRPARSRGLPSLAGRRPERGQLLPEPSAFQSPAPKSSLTAMWDRALSSGRPPASPRVGRRTALEQPADHQLEPRHPQALPGPSDRQ